MRKDRGGLLRGPDERGMYHLTQAGHNLLMGALKRSTRFLYYIERPNTPPGGSTNG